ncbi:MAG TPA: hypothetical protein VHH34_11025 [Pseudonocardiaceae bacterium]|nr:hypothetical protein [Pseudonocardiaceae bacterium]
MLCHARAVLIVFLGETFAPARGVLRELLPQDEIRTGPADRFPPGPIDVLVPAMGQVDAELMDATRPRLIQQFGAGLEGVELVAAAERGIPVAHVPAASTGNLGDHLDRLAVSMDIRVHVNRHCPRRWVYAEKDRAAPRIPREPGDAGLAGHHPGQGQRSGNGRFRRRRIHLAW